MVTIRNLTRGLLPLNVPELGTDTHKVGVAEHDPASGKRSLRVIHKEIPRSITLCAKGTPGDTISDLPDAVETSPEVLSAKKRGDIAVSKES